MTLAERADALLRAGPLRQPDRRSCGAAALVFAEMLRNPAYAQRILEEGFAAETLAMHHRLTGPVDAGGRLQPPWPPALGTPPWAVARHLGVRTGRTYAVRTVRSHRNLDVAVNENPVVFYVGSRWIPRHVVLVVGAGAGTMRCYEPSRGTVLTLRTLSSSPGWTLAGWHEPWFLVTPRAS